MSKTTPAELKAAHDAAMNGYRRLREFASWLGDPAELRQRAGDTHAAVIEAASAAADEFDELADSCANTLTAEVVAAIRTAATTEVYCWDEYFPSAHEAAAAVARETARMLRYTFTPENCNDQSIERVQAWARDVAGAVAFGDFNDLGTLIRFEHANAMQHAPTQRRALSVTQCAEMLQVSEKTIYRMMDSGLPYFRTGTARRVWEGDLLAFTSEKSSD